MFLLVTSAAGVNGNGFGALLAFEPNGGPRGIFIVDDRIADPRGLGVHSKEDLLFLNSGADRVLAISSDGRVVRDTGRIEGPNPGGGNFGPDGRYFLGLRSTHNHGLLELVQQRQRNCRLPRCSDGAIGILIRCLGRAHGGIGQRQADHIARQFGLAQGFG